MKNYSTGGTDWLDMDDKIAANSTSYTVRYLAPAVTYGFQLAAVNEAGHSNWEAKNLTMPADGKGEILYFLCLKKICEKVQVRVQNRIQM